MTVDEDYLATYYPGKYIRKTDKKGRFYYRDRETGKPVSKKTWENERKSILEAVEKRKLERKEGKKPTVKVPVWVSPEKRKKKEVKEKKKVRSKKWEEERRKQIEEIKQARKKLKEIEELYRKEQERIRKEKPKGGMPPVGPPKPPPVKPPEGPIGGGPGIEDFEYEEIEYFDVEEVSYTTD